MLNVNVTGEQVKSFALDSLETLILLKLLILKERDAGKQASEKRNDTSRSIKVMKMASASQLFVQIHGIVIAIK